MICSLILFFIFQSWDILLHWIFHSLSKVCICGWHCIFLECKHVFSILNETSTLLFDALTKGRIQVASFLYGTYCIYLNTSKIQNFQTLLGSTNLICCTSFFWYNFPIHTRIRHFVHYCRYQLFLQHPRLFVSKLLFLLQIWTNTTKKRINLMFYFLKRIVNLSFTFRLKDQFVQDVYTCILCNNVNLSISWLI